MIDIRAIPKADLKEVWRISYRDEHPAWVNYDAPFLHEYYPLTWEQFELTESAFFLSPQVKGLYIEGRICGAVNYYWVDEETRWLEIGIAIFDERYWGKGYGTQALRLWVTELFQKELVIQRIGLTTWSGNPGMANVAKKLNFQLEGRLRAVRYYRGSYYDSLYFGCLRSEWQEEASENHC